MEVSKIEIIKSKIQGKDTFMCYWQTPKIWSHKKCESKEELKNTVAKIIDEEL